MVEVGKEEEDEDDDLKQEENWRFYLPCCTFAISVCASCQ